MVTDLIPDTLKNLDEDGTILDGLIAAVSKSARLLSGLNDSQFNAVVLTGDIDQALAWMVEHAAVSAGYISALSDAKVKSLADNYKLAVDLLKKLSPEVDFTARVTKIKDLYEF